MTSRMWRYLTVTYLAFYVAAIAIERHGFFERGPMTPVEKILTAPIMWGLAVYGVQEGSVMGRFSWVDRSEKPSTFWIIVTFEVLYGLFLFCWGVRDAYGFRETPLSP
jgi:hypothetical protein